MAIKPNKQKRKFRKQSAFPGLRLLVVFVALSFVLLTVYAREGETGPIHTIKSGISNVLVPVQHVGYTLSTPFRALPNVLKNATPDQASLTELQEENAQLKAELAQHEESKNELKRLQDLLGLQSTYALQTKAARVIGGSTDAWNRSVIINKGSQDGLALNMPVVNSYGLIGQISEINLNSATVRLITDEKSGVSAMIQASRAQGIITGNPDGSLSLNYVTVDSTVVRGDVVLSAGLGGSYPRGLPIGEVSSVNRDSNALYYNIQVKIPYDIKSVEEVLVITKLNDADKQPIAGVKNSDEQLSGETSPAAQSQETTQAQTERGSSREQGENH